jgi:hypothetical protein
MGDSIKAQLPTWIYRLPGGNEPKTIFRCVRCIQICSVEYFDGPIRAIIRCPTHGDILGVEQYEDSDC